jgi:hypothetical protein
MLPFSFVRSHRRLALIGAYLLLPVALLCQVAETTAAQDAKQIKLTEKHVQGFIAAQKAMSAIAEKMENAPSDKPDPKIQAELEDVAKKNGFKDYAEYDDVAANISMVMAGIDPQTKEFTDAQVAIKKEIDEVNADKSIAAEERKQLLDELNESLKSAVTIQNRTNIDLVKKYYDKIDALMQ